MENGLLKITQVNTKTRIKTHFPDYKSRTLLLYIGAQWKKPWWIWWMVCFIAVFTPHWLVNCRVNKGLHFDWYHGRMSIKVINIQINSHKSYHFLSSCHMTYTALGHLELLSHLSFDPGVGNIIWSRRWQPTPVFLPGKSHGQRSLVGYRLWGLKELDRTEHARALHTLISFPHHTLK